MDNKNQYINKNQNRDTDKNQYKNINQNKSRKRYRNRCLAAIASFITILAIYILYRYNYISHRKYTNDDFGIEPFISSNDMDYDGINDQTDILESAKLYLDTKPKYKSKYYEAGYPDDPYGVCTDVVAFAMQGAGYDLRELVDQDITQHPEDYKLEKPDNNIDFRRVQNLKIYFKHTAESLTKDCKDIDQWQAGDIIIWNHHIGIISDHRNKAGIPFVLHNANPIQASYEEDILTIWGEIEGHYRVGSR